MTQRTVTVRIKSFRFDPAVITVSAGDSIAWLNDDAFTHTSADNNGTWSSPELAKGGRYALVAPAPGQYAYHCAAHPSMKAFLTVTAPPPP